MALSLLTLTKGRAVKRSRRFLSRGVRNSWIRVPRACSSVTKPIPISSSATVRRELMVAV